MSSTNPRGNRRGVSSGGPGQPPPQQHPSATTGSLTAAAAAPASGSHLLSFSSSRPGPLFPSTAPVVTTSTPPADSPDPGSPVVLPQVEDRGRSKTDYVLQSTGRGGSGIIGNRSGNGGKLRYGRIQVLAADTGAPHPTGMEMAIVPFHTPRSGSSGGGVTGGPPAAITNGNNGGNGTDTTGGSSVVAHRGLFSAVDSNQWALTTRCVCPSCLRPYDKEDDDDDVSTGGDGDNHGLDSDSLGSTSGNEEGDDGGSMRRRLRRKQQRRRRRRRRQQQQNRGGVSAARRIQGLLSPQYFRALLDAPVPLAIADGPNSSGAMPTMGAPLLTYVSPTGPDRGQYAFSTAGGVSVDPDHVLGVAWGGVDGGGGGGGLAPPSVRDTIPFQAWDDEAEEAATRAEVLKAREHQRHQQQQQQEEEGGPSPAPTAGPNGYYARYFVEEQKLGSGTFGGVYLCKHIMEGIPLGTFALKKIPVGDNIEYLQKVLREVRILEEVKRHPNVVEYNHSWIEEAQLADFGPPVRCLFILMEYASEGSLDTYLERYGNALSTVAVWYFFLSAVAGTAHLHQKQILHRDLKPQNLLLTGPPGRPPRVLVSDFGTSALLGEKPYDRTGGTGTLEYMAPELMELADPSSPRPPGGEEHYRNHHTKASDVWSLGMVLYYLACRATLPTALPDGSVMLANLQSRSPYPRPPEMVELIKAMLQRDPRRRPSCGEILSSTVVQTILRSFNSNLSSSSSTADGGGGGGWNGNGNRSGATAYDIMPCDASGPTSPVHAPGRGGGGNSPLPPHRFARQRVPLSDGPRGADSGRTHGGDGGYSDEEGGDDNEEERITPSVPTARTAGSPFPSDPLQSSRVELMSTIMCGNNTSVYNQMELPLVAQYRANDNSQQLQQRRDSAGMVRVPSAASNSEALPVMKRTRPSVGSSSPPPPPAAKRPRMVDAAVQTDPVNIAD